MKEHSEPDLFSYPYAAGYKDPDTSKKAAEGVDAKTLRGQVLAFMKKFKPLTTDECAGFMHLSPLSVRPRFTELVKLGEIYDTGLRRANASGRNAKVYAVKKGEVH